MQRFSRRTSWDTSESDWARRLRQIRASGRPVIDLTVANPTVCGFEYDAEAVLGPLGAVEALTYDPDPLGLIQAREAVSSYYADHDVRARADRIVLTTSTSEAYSFLFRLLCDAGDEVLIAQPSYPLFDFLADLDDVRLVTYPLFYDYGWHLDLEGLRRRITGRTRAIVVVHPNNPTGHFTSAGERAALEAICVEHGLALIVDEVFLDYPMEDVATADTKSFGVGEHPVATFVLSGLSKIAALPQMKAAWIACFGREEDVNAAMDRLGVITDTFLSMNAPVQWAMPAWLAGRSAMQEQVRGRIRANLRALDDWLPWESLVRRLDSQGGWYAVLRIPAGMGEDTVALELVERYGVAVHGGNFFGFGNDGYLVVSLLIEENSFFHGIMKIEKVLKQLLYIKE